MSEVVLKPVEGKPGVFADDKGNTFLDQKLHDNITAQRIAEEKSKIEAKSGDAVAQAQAAKEAAEAALNDAKAQLKTLESAGATVEQSNKALQETYDAIVGNLSNEAKELIPDYGSVSDKLKFITKNSARFFGAPGTTQVPQPKVPSDAAPPKKTESQNALPSWQETLRDPRAALAKLEGQSGTA
jgi:hypothetical protein